jgi:hypothetical protein
MDFTVLPTEFVGTSPILLSLARSCCNLIRICQPAFQSTGAAPMKRPTFFVPHMTHSMLPAQMVTGIVHPLEWSVSVQAANEGAAAIGDHSGMPARRNPSLRRARWRW